VHSRAGLLAAVDRVGLDAAAAAAWLDGGALEGEVWESYHKTQAIRPRRGGHSATTLYIPFVILRTKHNVWSTVRMTSACPRLQEMGLTAIPFFVFTQRLRVLGAPAEAGGARREAELVKPYVFSGSGSQVATRASLFSAWLSCLLSCRMRDYMEGCMGDGL
jgi:hypothetical protein